MKIDIGHRSAAIVIILGLDVVFFATWLAVLIVGLHNTPLQEVATKVFGVFMGANNSLFLILNTEARKDMPANPTNISILNTEARKDAPANTTNTTNQPPQGGTHQ